MKKELRKVIKAFEDLEEAGKNLKFNFKGFEVALKIAFPKKFKKHKELLQKIDDLNVEICEVLFEEGLICKGCSLRPDTCEGSNCGMQMDAFFSYRTKDEIQKICFKAIGNKFYNQSLRIKNELRK